LFLILTSFEENMEGAIVRREPWVRGRESKCNRRDQTVTLFCAGAIAQRHDAKQQSNQLNAQSQTIQLGRLSQEK
jgi:hypothetical protein